MIKLYLFLAILPTVIILSYVLAFDKNKKEPTSLCVKLFIYGCLTVIPAIFLERWLDQEEFSSYFDLFKYVFIGVALVEEGVKYVATYIVSFKNHAFDEVYDGIIYCVLVSLGFATIENIMYVFNYGIQTALIRIVTAVPAHAIFACTMGYFLGLTKANQRHAFVYKVLSIFVPVLIHAIYDFVLMADFHYGLIFFVVYLIFLYKKAFKLIRITSNQEPFR